MRLRDPRTATAIATVAMMIGAVVGPACGSESSVATGRAAPAQRPAQAVAAAPAVHADPELLRTLAILTTHKLPSASQLADVRGRLDTGRLAMPAYIDALVASPEFARDVAPIIAFRGLLSATSRQVAGEPLQRTAGSPPIYYLHEPCKPARAVAVRPWWSLDEDVRICPDSYKPDKWAGDRRRGATEVACKSAIGPDRGCGCGPNLIRCFPSKDALLQLQQSMRDEVRQTVDYVVSRREPIDALFLTNQTWRDREVETYRVTQVIEDRKIRNPERVLRDAAAWPAEGKWAGREDLAPGQNAGLLTSLQMLSYLPDRRQRMTTIYDVLYCDEPDSAGATPELVTKIAASVGGGVSFQISQDHWKELAGRPICTNCHARLDYGMQFFYGFDNVSVRGYFSSALQRKTRGPLYVRSIDDPRGEGPLTPQGFAQLAVAQPEHARCIARDFAEYVLAGRATADHVDRLAARFKPNQTTAQEMMRAALDQLVAEWPKLDDAPPARVPATATTSDGDLTVSAAVHKQLDERCADCHDGSDASLPDFSKSVVPREQAVRMLDAVAFGSMPKDRALVSADRAALIDPLVRSLWSGADADAARRYYIDRMLALPAYRPEVIASLVHQRAGAAGTTAWRTLEQSTRPSAGQAGPGLLTKVALDAIEACRQRTEVRAEVDACIADALRIEDIVVDHR
jgi:hypothetical protein